MHMASIAVAGVGTVFVRWNGAAWEAIAEINSITGPSMGRETIDVTSLDTEEGYRQFITGFKNGGTIVLAMNFTRDTYELMKDDFEVDDPHDYGMVLPDEDETVLQFGALVTELPMTIPADDKVTADVTLQITGEVRVLGGELSDGDSGEVEGLEAYQSKMAFWGGEFDFVNNLWLDKSGNNNHAKLRNASARTSLSGNLDYTMAGLLTSDTVEVVAGSDTPTIPANGILRISEGQVVYGVTIKRGGNIFAIIPFCEPHIVPEDSPSQRSWDVSGNGNHALAPAEMSVDNYAVQNNYFYLQEHGYTIGGLESLKNKWDFNTWTGEHPNQQWGGLDYKGGGILEPVAGGKAKLTNPYRIREYNVNNTNRTCICIFRVEDFTKISGADDQLGSTVVYNGYTAALANLVNERGLVNRNGLYRSEVKPGHTNFEISTSGYSTSQSWVLPEPPSVRLKILVPALISGEAAADGGTLEVIPDGETWLEWGCDLEFPDSAMMVSADQKGCWTDIIAGGKCLNGKTYLIEKTQPDHFGAGLGVGDEFVGDGTQGANNLNWVRELMPNNGDRGLLFTDLGVAKPVKWTDIWAKRFHFQYAKKLFWEDAKRTRFWEGKVNDLVIFKSDFYASSQDFQNFKTLFELQDVPAVITPVVISSDHLSNDDLPAFHSLMFNTRSFNATQYVDYGGNLSHANQIASSNMGDEIGLHSGWDYSKSTFVEGYKDFRETPDYYTEEEIRIYWQNCINHYLNKIGVKVQNHAWPGGSAGFSVVASEYFRTARGAAGSGLYNKLPLLNASGRYSFRYELSSPSLDTLTTTANLNTYIGYINTAILHKNLMMCYGHPSQWAEDVWTRFEALLDYIVGLIESGTMVRVYTLNTALDMIENNI